MLTRRARPPPGNHTPQKQMITTARLGPRVRARQPRQPAAHRLCETRRARAAAHRRRRCQWLSTPRPTMRPTSGVARHADAPSGWGRSPRLPCDLARRMPAHQALGEVLAEALVGAIAALPRDTGSLGDAGDAHVKHKRQRRCGRHLRISRVAAPGACRRGDARPPRPRGGARGLRGDG